MSQKITKTAEKRNYGLVELLRVVAILGVIWFHIEGLAHRRVGFSGLIAFVIIATVLIAPSTKTPEFAAFSKKRVRRLLLPWGVWFVVYLTLNVVTGRKALPYFHDPISTVLAGPWIGLWYLPFAFVAALLAYAGYRATRQLPHRTLLFASLICGLGLLVFAEFARQEWSIIRPWAQWLHAAPAIFFGFAIAQVLAIRASWWDIAAICATPLLYAGWSGFADPGLAITYLIAVPLTTLAFVVRVELPHFLPGLGSLCMGVYLLHGGLISALSRALPSSCSPYLLFVFTALVAFAGSFLLKRLPLIRDTV